MYAPPPPRNSSVALTRVGGTWKYGRDSNGWITTATDPLNRTLTYTLDAKGYPTLQTFPDGKTRAYLYQDAYHALTQYTDERGNKTTYTYDAQGRLETVLNALNEKTTFTYTNGLLHTVKDALNRVVTFAYDDKRRLLSETTQIGQTSYSYDANGNLEKVKDALNRVTTLVHDALGRLLKQTDALNQTTTWVYDGAGLLKESISPLGQKTSHVYDNRGQLTKVIEAVGTAAERSQLYSYDAKGQTTALRDPNGAWTSYDYDAVGRQRQATDPFGHKGSSAYDLAGQVLSTWDVLGRATEYTYDARGRVTQVKDAVGNLTTTVYDDAGNVASVKDALNRLTTYVYDKLNRREATVDALNNRATTVYDKVGNVSEIKDALNRTTTYLYDALNRRTGTIDALNNRTTVVYDAVGNVTSIKDALNRTTTFVYDDANRRTVTIDALNNRTTVVYDAAGNVSTLKDALNRTTTYLYDALNRQTTMIDALNNRTTTVYDAVDNVSAVTDPLGHTTQTAHDVLDRTILVIDALGNTSETVYDAASQVLTTVDPLGNRTSYVYDALGRRTEMRDALNNLATTVYDAVGNVQAYVDPRGNRTTFTYDALDRRTEVRSAVNNVSTTVYDAVGNVIRRIDAANYTTTYNYDALNRLISMQDPGTGIATTVYDAVGNVVNYIDALNQKTTLVYDALNRHTKTIDPRGGVTTLLYDEVGNQTGLIDSVNNRTTFVYDALNRLTQQTDPLNKSATFAYDAASRMTSTTDRLGRRKDFTYDDVNRLTRETWVASGGGTVNTLTHTYDANGNQLTAANSNGVVTTTYDALNRMATTQQPFGLTLTYSYDAASNRTKVEDSQNGVTTSVYDAANRLTRREFGGSGQTPLRVDLTYTARDQQETLTRYSDLAGTQKVGSSLYHYDAVSRLDNLKHRDSADVVFWNTTYGYDLAHRLTSEQANGTLTSFTYDLNDQLTGATGGRTESYSYDVNGNRTMTGYGTPAAGNRLTTVGPWTYTYNDEGNLIKKSQGASAETWTFGYDHNNRMVWAEKRATDGGTLQMRADYKYDALGRRLEKAVDPDGADPQPTMVTRFGYDGIEIWADLNSSNALTSRYIHGDMVDEWFARIGISGMTQTAYWYLTDRQGSVRQVRTSAGALQDEISYDSYGNIIYESNPSFAERIKYTGREADSETGLQYNRARYYDSTTGRWTSEDPIGFQAKDNNLYRYVKNRPLNATDPSGLVLKVGGEEFSERLPGKESVTTWKYYQDQKDNLTRKIIYAMSNSSVSFDFKNEKELDDNIKMRKLAIETMGQLRDNDRVRFPNLVDGKYEWKTPGGWNLIPNTTGGVSPDGLRSVGANSAEAIKRLTEPPEDKETKMDCGSHVMASYYKALLLLLERDAFNKVYPGGITIGAGAVDTGAGVNEKNKTKNAPFEEKWLPQQHFFEAGNLVPGDWVDFLNDPTYAAKHPTGSLKTEAVIYLGRFGNRGIPYFVTRRIEYTYKDANGKERTRTVKGPITEDEIKNILVLDYNRPGSGKSDDLNKRQITEKHLPEPRWRIPEVRYSPK